MKKQDNRIPPFSVLLSLYYKENPVFFEESIESILHNTVVPNQIVIVKDGLLSDELNKALSKYSTNNIFTIVGYEKNQGLGFALNYGLKYCKYDLVARMDTDDVCSTTRFEKQLDIFMNCNDFSIVGSNINEFSDKPDSILSIRKVPQFNDDIIAFSKVRNPFNHPSVMFKKDDVIKCGGYIELFRHEDYYLWYRMLKQGFIGFNIQEPLVNMRISNDFYQRRGGAKAFKCRLMLNKIMLKENYINLFEYFKVILLNSINFSVPSFIRKYAHKFFLRRKP